MYFRTQLTYYNYCHTCAVTNGSFKIDALQKHNYNNKVFIFLDKEQHKFITGTVFNTKQYLLSPK